MLIFMVLIGRKVSLYVAGRYAIAVTLPAGVPSAVSYAKKPVGIT
jgi:hypothetical protein